MTDKMIANIAQLKLAEITGMSAAVAALTDQVASRQSVIDSLTTRNQHFRDRLANADTIRGVALVNFNLAQAGASAAQALDSACEIAAEQAGALDEALSSVAEKKLDLMRQLVFVASLLEKTNHLANKQKAVNPQMPDALITLLGQAAADCAHAVALALIAQDSCLMASGAMTSTRGSLDLARQQSQALRDFISDQDGAMGQTGGIYQRGQQQYDAALTVSANAAAQLDHATGALATLKARLASLQAGLGMMNA